MSRKEKLHPKEKRHRRRLPICVGRHEPRTITIPKFVYDDLMQRVKELEHEIWTLREEMKSSKLIGGTR